MKRRGLLKSLLAVPFVGLLKSEPKLEPEPEFCKELQFGEVFDGRIVSMITFQGELWVATEKRLYLIKERK